MAVPELSCYNYVHCLCRYVFTHTGSPPFYVLWMIVGHRKVVTVDRF